MSEPQTEDTMIAGLLREREGLAQRGLKDRVAQVDEQLRLRGYKAPRRGGAQKPGTPTPAEVPVPPAVPQTEQKAEDEQRAQPPKGRQPQAKTEMT